MLMEATEVRANLLSHGTPERGKNVKSIMITPEQLENIPTPEPTRTWHPVAHSEVVERVREKVIGNGWQFINAENPFQLCITETYTKMFGVTKIVIPGYSDSDNEIQLALGFRNSHDKTLALRFALGSHVFVCSNLVISGDFQTHRVHTANIDVMETIERTFEQIPLASRQLIAWTGSLREKPISHDTGVSLLAEAVERKALPLGDFMSARSDFLSAYAGENPLIQHGQTYWAAYQACSAQYKKHDMHVLQDYSTNLNRLFAETVGGMN